MRIRQIAASITVVLSAFLLFVVEPLSSKELLPKMGGSSAVWLSCLCFFQISLLFGYLYAAILTEGVSHGRAQKIHLIALTISICWVLYRGRVSAEPLFDSLSNPTWTIFKALAVELGLPFLLLSATSPLLQVWLARWTDRGVSFRLFALSNLGSLLALLLYPTAIEPFIPLHLQRNFWRAGFAAYCLVCGCLIVGARKMAKYRTAPPFEQLTLRHTKERVHTGLSFLLGATGAIQLCTVTSHLTENISALPLLWIVPLGVYLLSFVLAFEFPSVYRRGLVLRFLVVMLASLGYFLLNTEVSLPLGLGIGAFLIELFLACWFCHAELYNIRPQRSSGTAWFYLALAAGGAAGTIVSVVIAPILFSANYDLPLGFAFTSLIALRVTWHQGRSPRLLWATSTVLSIALAERLHITYERNALFLERNFYGSLRVKESYLPAQAEVSRLLLHGTIEHGIQWFSPEFRRQPLSYYGRDSGVGLALRLCCQQRPRTLGVIGLGTGTLASYGNAGDTVRFYEINPAVEQVAKELFTYLRESRATVTIVTGDARRSLEKERSILFDVLVVDAFSGDAIPVHLLTLEAMQVYQRHLKSGGVLAFHISNQYVDLLPVVGSLAAHEGLTARVIDSPANPALGLFRAKWVIMADPKAPIFSISDGGTGEPLPKTSFAPWTDDYSSLMSVVRWMGTGS